MFVIASKQLALDLLTLLKAVLNNSCTGSCEMLLYVPAFTSQALGPFQPSPPPQYRWLIFRCNSEHRFSILPRQTLTGRGMQVIWKMEYTKPISQRLIGLARKEAYFFAWMFSWFGQGFLERRCIFYCFELLKCVIFRKYFTFSTSMLRLTAVQG